MRYTLIKRPHVIYCCHCTECQKQSSSAFGISVRVDSAALHVGGKLETFSRPSASGDVNCLFCPECGTRLFHKRATYSDRMNIKGGTFDDTSWIKPAGHIWVASKQAWVMLPSDALTYDHQPENYDTLTSRYNAQ
ncbi:MAG: GFA family protein [Pseudomonadota bacterium]